MSNTNAKFEMTGILLGQEACKRKTPQEKIAIIQQTMEPGMNVSHVARLHGIQPSLLFKWKKQYLEGSLTAVGVRSCHCGLSVMPTGRTGAVIGIMKKQTLKSCRISSISSATCPATAIDECGASCVNDIAQKGCRR